MSRPRSLGSLALALALLWLLASGLLGAVGVEQRTALLVGLPLAALVAFMIGRR